MNYGTIEVNAMRNRSVDDSPNLARATLLAGVAAAMLVAGCGAAPTTEDPSASSSALTSVSTGPGLIHPFGGNSGDTLCMEAASMNGGTGIIIDDCVPHAYNQSWRLIGNGQIQLQFDYDIAGEGPFPYCLNLKDASKGTVDIESCDAKSKTQAWNFQDGHFFPSYSDGCLDVFSGNPTPGTSMDVATCNGTPAQVFLPDGMNVQIYSYPSSSQAPHMLDVRGGDSRSTAANTPLDSALSNGSPAQYFAFSFPSVGPAGNYQAQIQDYASGQCVSWQLGASYNPAFLGPCQQNNDAYWYYTPSNQFVNREFQWCLDVLGAGTASGTPVDVTPCNGTGAQAWHLSLPGLKSPICKNSSGVNVNCSTHG
jgi:hypothetical protein